MFSDPRSLMQQWITCLTPDQKILGSSPDYLGNILTHPKKGLVMLLQMWMNPDKTSLLPYGLAVRISGFHPDGPGSTPGMGISDFCLSSANTTVFSCFMLMLRLRYNKTGF